MTERVFKKEFRRKGVQSAFTQFLYILSEVNNALSISYYLESNVRITGKNELERMRKETMVAYFKVPSRNLCEGTDELYGKPVRILRIPSEIRIEHLPIQA
jgi:hypothetical protein